MSPSLFAAQATFPLLPLIIAIPVLTAIVLLATPAKYSKYVALLGSVASGVLSINMLVGFDSTMGGMQFTEKYELLPALGLSWAFGVDGISLFLVVLTGILFPITLVATKPSHDSKSYHLFIMLLMAGAMGAFLSLDLLLFFLFFEIVLVPMYFLIGGWGHGDRVYAAMKFFLYTMAASALMLVGIVSLAYLASEDVGTLTFNVVVLAEKHTLSGTAATLIFLSFAAAFMVKVPVFPVHTWLPNAHTEAPTAGSVILAGVMLKLGTYGFLRFGLYLFPNVMRDLSPIFLTLGVAGIVYGAAVATMQRDLKRLVAYSSVAHMGFIILGIFAFNSQGLQGSVLQMVNHGISTGALFILVGWIYERRHTRQISQLGGLQKSAPVMAAIFTLVMLSSVGLPGLNGFPGEFLILLGGFSSARWWTVIAVTGVILAALYLLWAYQRVFHGPAEGENAEMEDVKPSEFLAIAPLLVLIVFMGVYPKPVLDRIEPSVDVLIEHVESKADDGFKESEPEQLERVGTAGLVDAAEKAHKKHKEEKESHGSSDGESENKNQDHSETSEGEHS